MYTPPSDWNPFNVGNYATGAQGLIYEPLFLFGPIKNSYIPWLVFQDPFSSYNPVFKAERVFELIRGVYFPHLRQPAWQDKIESALSAVALNPGDVMGKYPHQLSGGQQQRLLVARALLLDVRLLVADEIISMLDASTRVDILNLLINLKRSGLAICSSPTTCRSATT